MLTSLVASTNAERVLLLLAARRKGYAGGIAQTFGVAPSHVQRVLDLMERDGMLVSNEIGRTRVYEFNPRFAFRDQVAALFRYALARYPQSLQEKRMKNRRRSRRKDKPL